MAQTEIDVGQINATGTPSSTTALFGNATWSVPAGPGTPGFTTTATAAGTTTLVYSSTPVQEFTGTTTQTVALPTTSVTQGMQWLIINKSTGAVTVQASGGATVVILAGGTSAMVTANIATPALATDWDAQYGADVVASGKVLNVSNSLTLAGTDGTTQTFPSTNATIARTDAAQTFTGVQTMTSPAISSPTLSGTATGTYTLGGTPTISSPTLTTPALGTPSSGTLTNCSGLPYAGITPAPTASPTASTVPEWDASKNLFANNHVDGFATQAASATTLVLTVASAKLQYITGTTQTQLITLPTTSVVAGMQWTVNNNSAATVTVQSSGGNTVAIVAGGTAARLTAQVNTPTTAANWDAQLYNWHTDVVAPLINLTATTIPITTVTNVDSRGGISFPANVRLGTKIRVTVTATNTATIQTLTATLRFGTANTNADTAVLTQAFTAGTAVVGSGQFVFDFIVLTATTADARLRFYNGNNAATGIAANTSLYAGLSTPATIATTSATYLGVYFSSTVASIITVRSVAYEVLQ